MQLRRLILYENIIFWMKISFLGTEQLRNRKLFFFYLTGFVLFRRNHCFQLFWPIFPDVDWQSKSHLMFYPSVKENL